MDLIPREKRRLFEGKTEQRSSLLYFQLTVFRSLQNLKDFNEYQANYLILKYLMEQEMVIKNYRRTFNEYL